MYINVNDEFFEHFFPVSTRICTSCTNTFPKDKYYEMKCCKNHICYICYESSQRGNTCPACWSHLEDDLWSTVNISAIDKNLQQLHV